MEKYMPYIVTIVCAMVSGLASYLASRRQSKSDLQKLMKQHELDIEKEQEKFKLEKERMEIEHKNQLELKEKELANSLGASLTNTLIGEALKMPEVRQQLSNSIRKGSKKR